MIVFPRIPAGDPLSISASLYTTYLGCPARALAQMQGRYGPDSRASFSGMLAHRIFARHITSGPIGVDSFGDVCRQEIGQAMNPKLVSLQLRPSELRGVIAEVGSLYERFQGISTEGCRSVETELECNVAPGVTLRGRIDAVFEAARGVRLVDWKTGALGEAQSQLDFYALLWAIQHGELPATVEAASVASGESFQDAPTVAAITATAGRIVEMIAVMRRGFQDDSSAPRVGGPGCRFCPLRDECAEGMAALKVLSA